MRTTTMRLTTALLATALALTGAGPASAAAGTGADGGPSSAVGTGGAAGTVGAAAPAVTGIDQNSIELQVTPAVPDEGGVFQVQASGNAHASRSGNIVLRVTLAPASVECYPTSDLELARAERTRDPRWGSWWESYVGSNRPVHVDYLETEVFAGRPAGAYRLCGYLRGQGEGPDPYVMQRLDFTIDGTCTEATTSLGTAQKKVDKARAAVGKAATKAKNMKKAFQKAKKVVKKKKARKAKQKARKKMLRKKQQWNRSKKVLQKRRAKLRTARGDLARARERHELFCL